MLLTKPAIKPGVLPISIAEFREALYSVCSWNRIALAVSGGVDSMALAALCSRFKKEENALLDVTAFVVDHKLRCGSTTEANDVVQQLQDLGIPAHRLDLEWPQGVNPLELPNLETEARRLRFRALGFACSQRKIHSLLLAHHRDDQAETILTRLVNGRTGIGLQGIRPVADIPECYGIHGVYQSGRFRYLHKCYLPREEYQSPKAHFPRTETGGVRVMRPLLRFNKDRLLATCAHWNVPWVEDETNSDRTLTVRNAVRHIFQSHRLPAALTKESISALSNRIAADVATYQEAADKLFGECQVEANIRSGTVAVRFPDRASQLKIHSKGSTIAAMLVRRAVQLVTPEPEVSLQQLQTPVHQIFPDLFEDDCSSGAANELYRRFTAAGVMFSCRDRSKKGYAAGEWWLLSRQIPSRDLLIPFTEINRSLRLEKQPFQLFDGRFWIRVRNPSKRRLTVRLSRREELSKFIKSLDYTAAERLSGVLQKVAPGGIRYTLPMLVVENADNSTEPVALPTLRFKLGGSQADGEWADLAWDVRYRKMYLPRPPKVDGIEGNESVMTSLLGPGHTEQHHIQHL